MMSDCHDPQSRAPLAWARPPAAVLQYASALWTTGVREHYTTGRRCANATGGKIGSSLFEPANWRVSDPGESDQFCLCELEPLRGRPRASTSQYSIANQEIVKVSSRICNRHPSPGDKEFDDDSEDSDASPTVTQTRSWKGMTVHIVHRTKVGKGWLCTDIAHWPKQARVSMIPVHTGIAHCTLPLILMLCHGAAHCRQKASPSPSAKLGVYIYAIQYHFQVEFKPS